MPRMELTFHTLDVFTDRLFTGNPLAVVRDADALTTEQMQAVAREFNLSETVFFQKPENPAHTAKVRIFTPGAEIPFAGHPTIGAAILAARLKAPDPNSDLDCIIALEQKIGIVRVGVRLRKDQVAYAEFDAPKLPEEETSLPPVEMLAAAVGLLPREIGFANHRPTRFAAGNSFAFVPVASLEAMGRARVNSQHWQTAVGGQGFVGVYLYCRETVHTTSHFHARMFAPDVGIAEDPATGSAAVTFAGVIQKFDALPDGHHKRIIEQGYEMGRPSIISLALDVAGGRLRNVRIGGSAVCVTEGRITI